MDLTSIIGVVLGLVLIVFVGITPSLLGNFWDGASMAIVIGGTLSAVIASYPLSKLKDVPKHMKILLQGKRYRCADRYTCGDGAACKEERSACSGRKGQ